MSCDDHVISDLVITTCYQEESVGACIVYDNNGKIKSQTKCAREVTLFLILIMFFVLIRGAQLYHFQISSTHYQFGRRNFIEI